MRNKREEEVGAMVLIIEVLSGIYSLKKEREKGKTRDTVTPYKKGRG